jgi:hypothetical protein
VSERKPFLLRVDPAVFDAVQRWANDDLRSLNAQIEFLLRRALQDAGRSPQLSSSNSSSPEGPRRVDGRRDSRQSKSGKPET